MAKTEGSGSQKEPVKNLHVEVPESFHRRVKMLCVMQGSTLKDYALSALEEKVARDEEEMRKSK
jgi:predicted HicB family RNase H-like nuclease